MKTITSWMILGCLAVLPLHAATQVEEVWGTYGGNGFFNWEIKGATAYGEARHRSETSRSRFFSRKPLEHVTIERTDLDLRWEIDPRKKRYTEERISAAREKAAQEIARNQAEWDKKTSRPEKESEPTVRIKRADTKVTGPGAAVTLNGFSCRPFTVKTTIDYESLPDHKPAGRQTLYQKLWTTDAAILVQYQKDQHDYWKSVAEQTAWTKRELMDLQKAFQTELSKAEKDATVNPWASFASALSKVQGYPVRTLATMTLLEPEAERKKSKPQPKAEKSDDLVQSGDLSNGVGGLVGGIATRWASKKVEKKVQEKIEERPDWVDEIAKDLDSEAVVGWGWMTEVKSAAKLDKDSPLFELPAGYKKVNSL